jgi:hypothetical protein
VQKLQQGTKTFTPSGSSTWSFPGNYKNIFSPALFKFQNSIIHFKNGRLLVVAASHKVDRTTASTMHHCRLANVFVHRTLVAATVGTSLLVHGQILPPFYVAFLKETVFTVKQIPQLWRLVTPFLITGPKFGLLMDPYFREHRIRF